MGDQSSNQIVSIDPEREEKVAELVSTARDIRSATTDVTRFQAGRALQTMFPGENLEAESKKIADEFDAHAGELAVSNLGAKAMRSSTANRVLEEVRAYQIGPAQSALDSFTGIVKSVDPSLLNKRPLKFIIEIYNPIKAFFKSLQSAEKRLESGKRELESERQRLVKNISNLDGLERDSKEQMRDLLIVSHAAELVTDREEQALRDLEAKDGTDDLSLPQRIDDQRSIVARLNRRTLDLKAAALRALLQAKVADAGQKSLVVIHDDLQFAVRVLSAQFASEIAAAIILFQGKKAGDKSRELRTASADLTKTTGQLLGEVTEIGTAYLTNAEEDLRGLTNLRDSIIRWSERNVEVANLARQARESAEKQMQEISTSLQNAARAYSAG